MLKIEGGEEMKRILTAAAVIFLGLFLVSGYNNVFAKSKNEADAEAIAQLKKAREEENKRTSEKEKIKALEESARKALKAKEWAISISPESGSGKAEADVITFSEEGKISSKNLIAKGYHASNLALTIQDGGVAVWETMQSDENQNLAFLRGELRGGEMTGTIFMKSVKGIGTTYHYSTTFVPVPAQAETPVKKNKKKK